MHHPPHERDAPARARLSASGSGRPCADAKNDAVGVTATVTSRLFSAFVLGTASAVLLACNAILGVQDVSLREDDAGRSSEDGPEPDDTRETDADVGIADQGELASVFASKALPAEKFEAVTHTEEHGVPVLDGAVSWIACSLRELLPGGDHTIGIGEVLGTHVTDREPLVFAGGQFRALR